MPHDDLPSDYRDQYPEPGLYHTSKPPQVQVRTPEAIREGIDRRAGMTDADHERSRRGIKRPITVHVEGDRGSGKTTLIAVVAQALENSGHRVNKQDHVPNATTAVMALHEQFDVTFVEGESQQCAIASECAKLRATIDEMRGSIAGLSNEGARLRDTNRRLVSVDEALRTEIASLKMALGDAMAVIPITQEAVREQIDMAFEEVRQAAYLEVERNRVRSAAEDLKQQARKLGQEGDARLQKARERMLFALTGGRAVQPEMDHMPGEVTDLLARPSGPRTLFEQAQDVYAGSREGRAVDKLQQANLALMGDLDFSEGC